jgi:hypothetical protein
MNLKINRVVIAVVALLAIGFGLGDYVVSSQQKVGSTVYDVLHQVADLRQGMADTLEFTNGIFVGPTVSSTNIYASSTFGVGNSTTNNQIKLIVTGTSTLINGTTTALVLGVPTSTTPGTSTIIQITSGIPANGLAVGDPCFLSTNVTSTSALLFDNCTISSVATTTASATVDYFNGGIANLTVPTGTVIRYEIHHLAF